MSETVLVAILSGGVGSGIVGIILAVLQRKWTKEDRVDALISAQKVLMVDRVRHLGKSYITDKEISIWDKENIKAMYDAYKKLGGNGDLDTIMEEVSRLPVVEN